MSAELAGALTQRVTLQRRGDARDDLGGADGAWADVAGLWAALTPETPAGWGAGDRPAAARRWRAVIRAGVAVAIGDRLRWRLRLLAVRAVAADPATPDRLTLMLEELP